MEVEFLWNLGGTTREAYAKVKSGAKYNDNGCQTQRKESFRRLC